MAWEAFRRWCEVRPRPGRPGPAVRVLVVESDDGLDPYLPSSACYLSAYDVGGLRRGHTWHDSFENARIWAVDQYGDDAAGHWSTVPEGEASASAFAIAQVR